MPTFKVYNIAAEEVGIVDRPVLFETAVDQKLIHRYFVWVRSMLRPSSGHTKTRGQVSGGGKKPWKQKGTGRARVGSSRSPIWRHGGIIFGPTSERNWATRMPRGERRKAMFSALASKAESIVVLDDWTMEAPKTKTVVATLAGFEALTGKKVLHVHAAYNHSLFASTNNLEKVTSTTVQNLNVIDLLNADSILITRDSLDALSAHFTTV
jgi:large subunit ribosomal protein L4